MGLIPEVEQPLKKQMFKEKLMWTGTVLFIYLICCQIPLYGTIKQEGGDPMYWLRVILASNKGTLMELGISPTITSSMIMQLLSGTKLIDVNMRSQMDRECFNATTKFFGFIMAVGEALAYSLSGMYGPPEQLGIFNLTAIILQLTLAGIVVQLLDELLQKGYGFGNGISLFIATNICEIILWKSFSPITIKTDQDTEFEGAIIALFHSLLTKSNKVMAIQHAFYRENAPNISSLLATVIVFFVVIYFQGFRVELTLSHRKVRGYKVPYPIKLFYTSNIPIILQSAFVSNLYFFSTVLHRKYKGNYFVGFLGKWADSDVHGNAAPIGGLAYYVCPPRSLFEIQTDPFHALFYYAFVMCSCAFFSRLWIDISGQSPREICRQLMDQDLMIEGWREQSMVNQLRRYINTAATFGGICIGALCIFADFMGAIGSGTGILLAVTIIYQYFEQISKENQKGLNDAIF
jgi:protein transport protein SEC61 subunit alpha